MKTVLCSKRLTRFCGRQEDLPFAIWKAMATTTMAEHDRQDAAVAAAIRCSQARRYWPSDWATSSGGTSAAAAAGAAAVRSTTGSAAAIGESSSSPGHGSGGLLDGGGAQRPRAIARCATGGHVVDDALPVEAGRRSWATIRPRCSTAIRSATSKTSLRLWEITITARPWS